MDFSPPNYRHYIFAALSPPFLPAIIFATIEIFPRGEPMQHPRVGAAHVTTAATPINFNELIACIVHRLRLEHRQDTYYYYSY
jgi:hypothetical protein